MGDGGTLRLYKQELQLGIYKITPRLYKQKIELGIYKHA